MNNKNINKVYKILREHVEEYKVPVVDLIEIETEDPFKVLIATILSARTKDEVTAQVCKRLFAVAKTFNDINKLSAKELEELIYPVGFYKIKARHLKELPKIIAEKFNSKIPNTIEELIQLPGVGRKTANLVVSVAFKKDGLCVDTHVHRIINRLGYIKAKTPFETEMKLRKKLPNKYWPQTNRIFVALGQNLCRPVSPFCSKCPIRKYCPRIGVVKSR